MKSNLQWQFDMLSPLQVNNRWFGEVSLTPTEGLTEEELKERSVTFNQSITVNHGEKNTLAWTVKLRIEIIHPEKGSRSIYTGAVEAFGEFKLHEDCPEEERGKFACASGGAVLYASIKELICSITSRSLHGMLELPTIDARCFLPKKHEADSTKPE